jgi:hypothetical protein
LQAAVDIEVVALVVVLQESRPEQVVGEIDLDPWCDKEEVILAIGFWECQVGLLKRHAEVTPRLNP